MPELDFQVTDKDIARVLVELHNKGLFAGGLVMVGTLAFMAWLKADWEMPSSAAARVKLRCSAMTAKAARS